MHKMPIVFTHGSKDKVTIPFCSFLSLQTIINTVLKSLFTVYQKSRATLDQKMWFSQNTFSFKAFLFVLILEIKTMSTAPWMLPLKIQHDNRDGKTFSFLLFWLLWHLRYLVEYPSTTSVTLVFLVLTLVLSETNQPKLFGNCQLS